MEHLDLYVSGKTRVYFYAMNFEGKPLLLIPIAFCFLEFSVTLFQKHNRFPQNKLLWQQSFHLISLLVFSRVSVDCYSPGTVCIHNTSATAQKPDLKWGQKPEAAFHIWRSFAEHLLGSVVSCWAGETRQGSCLFVRVRSTSGGEKEESWGLSLE